MKNNKEKTKELFLIAMDAVLTMNRAVGNSPSTECRKSIGKPLANTPAQSSLTRIC